MNYSRCIFKIKFDLASIEIYMDFNTVWSMAKLTPEMVKGLLIYNEIISNCKCNHQHVINRLNCFILVYLWECVGYVRVECKTEFVESLYYHFFINGNIFIFLYQSLCCLVAKSHLTLLRVRGLGLQPARLLRPWNFPSNKTVLGCHFLLQGIFCIQGSNLHLLHSWLYFITKTLGKPLKDPWELPLCN